MSVDSAHSADEAAVGTQEVYVCGLVTEVCVRAAALDAAKMGFTTIVVEDACGALEQSPGDEARVLDELRAAGATVTTSAVLLGKEQG
jgi:nicotinamidase/pyrazinamidase